MSNVNELSTRKIFILIIAKRSPLQINPLNTINFIKQFVNSQTLTLAQIYKSHSSLVYTMAYKYALNAEDAEEITQDVFLKVHEKIGEFRSEAKLETWIYRITINRSIDFLRSKKRQKNQVHFRTDNEAIPNLASEYRNPARILESDEGIRNLMSCIYQLPENQQQAIILLKMEQKSQKEVAEILNSTPKAVESLFQRAKTNLKKLLQEARENT